ncbi:MAG TPA: universal stress protein [Planctomycetota bacterium]|nr:universal stress protein [Planctomycetota bacterium]
MLPPRRTLVGYDFTRAADSALAHAIAWSGKRARVSLLYAEPVPYLLGLPTVALPGADLSSLRPIRDDLERIGRTAAKRARVGIESRAVPGSPAAVIVDAADRGAPDLVAVGAHGSRLRRALLGSVAETVAREAKGPVLVARGEPRTKAPIVVGIDLSAHSLGALKAAVALGESLGAPVHAVCVLPPFGRSRSRSGDEDEPRRDAHARAGRALERCRAKTSRDVDVSIREGEPAKELLAAASALRAGLVVLARRGLSPIERLLLGSIATRVLRRSEISVLVVPRARPR